MTLRALVLCQSKSLTDWLLTDWLKDWVAGWLADWLTADWLTDWLLHDWQTDWQTDWLTADWLTGWLTDCWLTDWLTDWLTADWLTGWLAGWLTDWLTAAWLTDRQTDWLTDLLSACNEWGVNSTIILRRYSKHPWGSLIRIFCTCAQKALGLRSKEQVEDNIFERKVSWIKSSVQFVAKLNTICIYTTPLIKWPRTWLPAARGDYLKFTK